MERKPSSDSSPRRDRPAIKPGLVSVTFRQLSAEAVIDRAVRAGLAAIEWGGDVHVPPGDIAGAREIGRRTAGAGLAVAGYASYYRAGTAGTAQPPFELVVETARALGAPLVRVWAGKAGSLSAGECDRHGVAQDLARIVLLADEAGCRVALEFHDGTLADDAASTMRLLKDEVAGGRLLTHWQPLLDDEAANEAGLAAILPWLAHLHVFHWERKGHPVPRRRPLSEGAGPWRRYLAIAAARGGMTCALLEFVQGDDEARFMADAGTLKGWLRCVDSNDVKTQFPCLDP